MKPVPCPRGEIKIEKELETKSSAPQVELNHSVVRQLQVWSLHPRPLKVIWTLYDKLKHKHIQNSYNNSHAPNKKLEKQNFNYDLNEKYTSITIAQEKRSNLIKDGQLKQAIPLNDIQLRQANQLQAIEDQANKLDALATKSPSLPFLEGEYEDEDGHQSVEVEPRIIDDESNTAITTLLGNHLTAFKFTEDNGEFYVKRKIFEFNDKTLSFTDGENWTTSFQVTPKFFDIFRGGNNRNIGITEEERQQLESFIIYAGGLKGDKRSKLYYVHTPSKKKKNERMGSMPTNLVGRGLALC